MTTETQGSFFFVIPAVGKSAFYPLVFNSEYLIAENFNNHLPGSGGVGVITKNEIPNIPGCLFS